jgi:hypothetical protein
MMARLSCGTCLAAALLLGTPALAQQGPNIVGLHAEGFYTASPSPSGGTAFSAVYERAITDMVSLWGGARFRPSGITPGSLLGPVLGANIYVSDKAPGGLFFSPSVGVFVADPVSWTASGHAGYSLLISQLALSASVGVSYLSGAPSPIYGSARVGAGINF